MAKLIDLHMHGPIGFQKYWLKNQGYENKNVLQLIFDSFEKNTRKSREFDLYLANLSNHTNPHDYMGICAITSQTDKNIDKNGIILRGSVDDRFSKLEEYAEKLPDDYDFEKISDNLLTIKKKIGGFNYESTYRWLDIVNGQTVIIRQKDKKGDVKQYDHLVIGSNKVPNLKDFDYIIKYCHDNNLVQGLEHIARKLHYGIGENLAIELLDKHRDKIDFIECTALDSRKNNEKAIKLAEKYDKNIVWNSDAHMCESAGLSHSEILISHNPKAIFNNNFIISLKRNIRSGLLEHHINYESFFNKLVLGAKFKWRHKFHSNIE